MPTITLPPETRDDRLKKAIYSPEDIERMKAFISSMRQRGEALDRNGSIVRLPADVAQQFWQVGTQSGKVTFNRATLEYLRNNTPIKPASVKAAADAAVKTARSKMFDLAQQLQQGKITPAEWAVEHNVAIKTLVGAESALARGGFGEMAESDWSRASELTADQWGYSRAFAEDVVGGRYGKVGDELSEMVIRRAGMYSEYGRAVFENTQVENARDRLGHTKARRILATVNNCNECIEEADKGWQNIDDIAPIGSLVCHSYCHCIIITGVEGNLVD